MLHATLEAPPKAHIQIMRAIFSIIALLFVVLTIGLLVKKQLQPAPAREGNHGNSDSSISQPVQPQQAQQQVRDALKSAEQLQQKNMQQAEQ